MHFHVSPTPREGAPSPPMPGSVSAAATLVTGLEGEAGEVLLAPFPGSVGADPGRWYLCPLPPTSSLQDSSWTTLCHRARLLVTPKGPRAPNSTSLTSTLYSDLSSSLPASPSSAPSFASCMIAQLGETRNRGPGWLLLRPLEGPGTNSSPGRGFNVMLPLVQTGPFPTPKSWILSEGRWSTRLVLWQASLALPPLPLPLPQ